MSSTDSCSKPVKRRGLYLCKKCKAHGIHDQPVRNHKRICPFKDCQCPRCALVEHGRRVVAQQIQNYRMQLRQRRDITDASTHTASSYPSSNAGDARTGRGLTRTSLRSDELPAETVDDNAAACRRCRNHGQVSAWKGHKQICAFR